LNSPNQGSHLDGNMRKSFGASFQHNSRNVVIKEYKRTNSENYNEGIAFYKLTFRKSASSGNVIA
jgi:hypothetical protein